MKISACLLIIVSCLIIDRSAKAQTPTLIYDTAINAGLSLPVELANAGDGSNRLFIVEQDGLIKIHNGTSVLPTPFLNLTSLTNASGEQGLLSLAFHPQYASNGYFFVYYTDPTRAINIARYHVSADPNIADPLSVVILMTIPKPFDNHNGGHLAFGRDGYLYFGTGDGGSGGDPNNFAQNGNSYLGKMIRIDVNNFTTPPYYSIPPDNPYVSNPSVLDEIWAIGVRNPWRWSFDRATGDVWIADVGQGAREEVNFRDSGTSGGINYGWRCYEGFQPFNTSGCAAQSSYVSPVFDYPHNGATGGFSITGGYVYRGAMNTVLQGFYVCADYVSGNQWVIKRTPTGTFTATMQTGLPGSISSFGEAENGELYAVSRGSGIIYKVNAIVLLPVRLRSFSGRNINSSNELTWITENETNVKKFNITYSETGSAFQPVAEVLPINNNGSNTYHFTHQAPAARAYYRLEIVDLDGTIRYSPVVTISSRAAEGIKYSVNGNTLSVFSNSAVQRIAVYSSNGLRVWMANAENRSGYFIMTIPTLADGVYTVVAQAGSISNSTKIIIGH